MIAAPSAGRESVRAYVEPPPPRPTARYASLEAARDSVDAILHRFLDLGDTAIHVSRERVTFDYIYAKASASAWAIRVIVNDTTACPHEALGDSLKAAGWVPNWDYGADGTDGGVMGYLSVDYLCVVAGEWIGGDDTDSTYVPPPGCKVTVTCVPRREDDVYTR
jgi:hypothetical protein